MLPSQIVLTPAANMEEQNTLRDLRSSLATRLRRVCNDLEDREFAAFVDRVARIELKYRDPEGPDQTISTLLVQPGAREVMPN